MKHYFILVLLATSLLGFGQQTDFNEEHFDKKNEVRINIFDLVVAGSLGVGYERYFDNNQSISADLYFFDHFNYYDIGYDDYKSEAFSLKLAYNFYFSKKKIHKGFVFYPFMRFRTGNIIFEDYYYDGSGTYTEEIKHDVGSFVLGFGLGHKWRMANDRVTLGLKGELGRVLGGEIDTDWYSNVEFRTMVNLGYTF